MLASLQKQMEEQRAKANREREKAALERDATACVHNQLITQIEILRKSQSTRNQRAEGSRTPPSPPGTARATRTESSWRRNRTHSPSDNQHSENSGSYKAPKVSCIEGIEEIIRKRIEDASQHFRKEAEPCGLRTFDSLLSEEITSHRFLKKFVMPSFECYAGAIDPIQHLCQYQDNMVVHFQDDFLMSRLFPSSLKGAAYDWFYTLPRQSLWSFEEVKQVFYHQYASRRELKKNNMHLLTIKMKPGESLKQYVDYFHSQMTLVYNCNDDVVAAAFISGMQVTHSFYKYLVKHEVTKMRDILAPRSIFKLRMLPGVLPTDPPSEG